MNFEHFTSFLNIFLSLSVSKGFNIIKYIAPSWNRFQTGFFQLDHNIYKLYKEGYQHGRDTWAVGVMCVSKECSCIGEEFSCITSIFVTPYHNLRWRRRRYVNETTIFTTQKCFIFTLSDSWTPFLILFLIFEKGK